MKYLHDDEETPNIKLKKLNSNMSKKKSDNKNKIENKNEILLPPQNNNNIFSFQNFVNEIKNYDYGKRIKWDSEIHKSSLINDTNSYKIKLTELISINYMNPLLILNNGYTKPNYQLDLFEQEIIHINDQIQIKNNKSNYNILSDTKTFLMNLFEEKEKFELNKKILKYYMEYYCKKNLEKIYPSLKEIEQMQKDINLYCEKIHNGKEKMKELKKFNIDNTMKLILRKKKLENLMKLYCFLKNNVLKCYKDIKKLKLKNMNYDYINYYNELNKINKSIDLLEKNIDIIVNENNININNIKKESRLIFFEAIKNKLKKKREKFNLKYISDINNLFEYKKSNVLQLYYLFNIDNSIEFNNNDIKSSSNNQSNLFVTKMEKSFKLRSKKLILETVNFHKKKERKNSNSITILNLNNLKLSEINNINIEDSNILICFKNILSKLKTLVENFFFYFDLLTQNTNLNDNKDYIDLKEELISRKQEFYEIIDKHLSKLLRLFYNPKEKQKEEKILPKIYFLIIINLLCLFGKLLKFKFNLNYSKYLNLALKNYIVYYIKLENKNKLKKALILIKNDYWEKTILDKKYFDFNNIKEKTPFYLKKFINFLNEDEIEENQANNNDINKNNIENIFNYIINNENNDENNNNIINMNFENVVDSFSNKKGIKFINKNSNNKILDKPLKYDFLYINNSSMCILRGIEEQISNLIIFEFLIYEIFSYLFNSVDIYIFICFKMFLNDNKYLSNLLKNINIKDIQKNLDNIDHWSDVISYQEKYPELKKFIISSEKKFYEYYGYNKKFQNEEEKHNYIDNLIPKLKDILMIDVNFNKNEKNVNKKNGTKNDNQTKSEENILKNNQNNIDPDLLKEMEQKISESNFKYITIFISCINTFYKVLKRLINFTSKIELDFQKNQITEKIYNYKKLIKQITYFFYMKISLNLTNFEKISPLIIDSDFSPSPEEGATQLFEQSFWVTKLINLFEAILKVITDGFNEIFEEKKLIIYFNILIKFIASNIQDNFSQVKNCNDTGRSIMLKDIKFLKQGIESGLKKYNLDKKINTNELFDIIIQYVNSWYYDTDEMTKFIVDNNIQFKYFQSLFLSAPLINDLEQEKKYEFFKKITQKYLIHFKEVISSLKS